MKLICGDCREILKTLPEQSVHCCVTSPPYWGLRDYGVDGQIGLEQTPDAYVAEMVAVFREVRRVLRDDGTLWLNLGDSYANSNPGSGGKCKLKGAGRQMTEARYTDIKLDVSNLKPKDLVGIPWRVAFALQADGWWLRSDIIWSKKNCMPESVRDRPTKSHEHLFLLSKSAKYYYDQESIMEPVQSGPSDIRKMIEKKDRIDAKHFHVDAGKLAAANHRTSIGNKRAVGGRRIHGNIPGRDDEGKACNNPEQLFRNKRDVWTIATQPFKGAHFAVFPPDLIRPCVLAGCPAGGTVLDPFSGAGTTGVVAAQEGRNFIGIELNPDYAEMARQRIEPEQAQTKLAI